MRAALTLAAALLLVGCATRPAAPLPTPPAGATIAALAASLIGTPYQFGGADAAGFDCSGLARYVHQRVGLLIPRTAAAHAVPRTPCRFRGSRREIWCFFTSTRAASTTSVSTPATAASFTPRAPERWSHTRI
jgi:NlpC/P60 family